MSVVSDVTSGKYKATQAAKPTSVNPLTVGQSGTTSTGKPDLKTVAGLVLAARQAGQGNQAQAIVDRKPLNIWKTAMSLLSRGQYASAGAANQIAKQVKGQAPKSVKDIGMAAYKGLKEGVPTSYSDVLATAGVQNKGVRAVGGFIGDVALDPLTYLQPEAKILKPGAALLGKVGEKLPLLGKAAEGANKVFAKPLKDAFGELFVHGHGVTPSVIEKVSTAGNQLRTAKSGIVQSALDRLSLPKADESKVFQALVETRLAEYAAREGKASKIVGDFAQGALEKMRQSGVGEKTIAAMAEQLKRAKGFAGKAGLDNPYEAYFPFLKAENLKKVEQGVTGLKVGSMGYIKKFQAKLKPEDIINSIPEAYARREFQIVRDKITSDSLRSVVKDIGKKFASEEEARLAGYVPLREKGQFGTVLGYVPEKDAKFVQQTFNPEFGALDKIAKVTGFDWATNQWKAAVTKYFPAFHLRNYVSGIEQNFQTVGKDAFDPRLHMDAVKLIANRAGKRASEAITLGKRTFKTSQLAKAYEDRFGRGDWKHVADIGESIWKERNLSLPSRAMRGLGKANLPGRLADHVGDFVETNQKMVAYLASLRQGKSIPEALKIAEQAGFDYSRITPFERNIMKRIIPFYSYTRKNLELQAKTLLQSPGRTAAVGKATDALSTGFSGAPASPEEQASLPAFVQQGLNIRTGETDKYGRPLYLGSLGTAPEAAAQQFSGNPIYKTIAQSNPILKFLFEKNTGINTFRSVGGGQVDIADVKNADKYADAPSLIKKFLGLRKTDKKTYANGKAVGTRVGYEADPTRLHILESLPTSRLLTTYLAAKDAIGKGQNVQGLTKKQQIMNLVLGGKYYAVDPEEAKYYKDKQTIKDLTSLLENSGTIRTFSTPYIPKK